MPCTGTWSARSTLPFTDRPSQQRSRDGEGYEGTPQSTREEESGREEESRSATRGQKKAD
jgi:hypothetical protein